MGGQRRGDQNVHLTKPGVYPISTDRMSLQPRVRKQPPGVSTGCTGTCV